LRIGANIHGDVIVSNDETHTLSRYSFSQNTFTQVWGAKSAPLPFTASICYKGLLPSGRVLLSHPDRGTSVLSSTLGQGTHYKGKYGHFHAALPGDLLAYAQDEEGQWVIAVYHVEGHERAHTLQPPQHHQWSRWTPITGHPGGGRVAVVDGLKRSLNIYENGELSSLSH
jgi:hypothetical protein